MRNIPHLFPLSLISVVVLGAAPVSRSYIPLSLSRMVMAADVAVHGTIIKVDADTFVLDVENLLVGELPGLAARTKKLEVHRFKNWTCASRWSNYALGQEVVRFLSWRDDDSQGLRIMSAGGEGEMPVVQDLDADDRIRKLVLVRGSPWQHFLGEHETRKVHGGKLRAVPTDLRVFLEAVRGLHECFRVHPFRARNLQGTYHIEEQVETTAIKEYAARSTMAWYLLDAVRSRQ